MRETHVSLNVPQAVGLQTAEDAAGAGVRLDWLVTLLNSWLVIGFYLDGWAHHTRSDLETFYTPRHALMYSGFFVTMVVSAGLFVSFLAVPPVTLDPAAWSEEHR